MSKKTDITVGQLVDHLFTAMDILKAIVREDYFDEDEARAEASMFIKQFDSTFGPEMTASGVR